MKTKAIKVLASPAVSWILYILSQGNWESLQCVLLQETRSDGPSCHCRHPKFSPFSLSDLSLVVLLSSGKDARGEGREEEKGGLNISIEP